MADGGGDGGRGNLTMVEARQTSADRTRVRVTASVRAMQQKMVHAGLHAQLPDRASLVRSLEVWTAE